MIERRATRAMARKNVVAGFTMVFFLFLCYLKIFFLRICYFTNSDGGGAHSSCIYIHGEERENKWVTGLKLDPAILFVMV